MFRGYSGVFRGVQVVFRACSGEFRGCSGVFRGVAGQFLVLQTPVSFQVLEVHEKDRTLTLLLSQLQFQGRSQMKILTEEISEKRKLLSHSLLQERSNACTGIQKYFFTVAIASVRLMLAAALILNYPLTLPLKL